MAANVSIKDAEEVCITTAFLQYQQMAFINWDKFEVSIAALASAMTSTIIENSIVLTTTTCS
jgi:hypothetical protein